MSAFIVNNRHLDYLISAGLKDLRYGPLRWLAPPEEPPTEPIHERGEPWGPGYVEQVNARRRELTRDTAGHVGAMLAAENRRSVDHRYDESELEDFYTFRHYDGTEAVQTLKAIACYEYQSCEHPEWEQSEAHAFCEALRHKAIAGLRGYDAAHWEIPAKPTPRPREVTA